MCGGVCLVKGGVSIISYQPSCKGFYLPLEFGTGKAVSVSVFYNHDHLIVWPQAYHSSIHSNKIAQPFFISSHQIYHRILYAHRIATTSAVQPLHRSKQGISPGRRINPALSVPFQPTLSCSCLVFYHTCYRLGNVNRHMIS